MVQRADSRSWLLSPLVEESTYEGLWFLPGTENQVSGTLRFSPTAGLTLKLNGTVHDHPPFGHKSHDVLCGFTSRGQQITLVNAYTQSSTIALPGYATETFTASTAFIGAHFGSSDAIQFKSVAVRDNVSRQINSDEHTGYE